ncbi:hypothetical protein IWZ00DRAFT_322472 [Phyllosticta capitalensis]|uniref:uncharacterized protein n=1 Tax=Phyllosticta capitalensis TaxID=121624 RepID=UPI0031316650
MLIPHLFSSLSSISCSRLSSPLHSTPPCQQSPGPLLPPSIHRLHLSRQTRGDARSWWIATKRTSKQGDKRATTCLAVVCAKEQSRAEQRRADRGKRKEGWRGTYAHHSTQLSSRAGGKSRKKERERRQEWTEGEKDNRSIQMYGARRQSARHLRCPVVFSTLPDKSEMGQGRFHACRVWNGVSGLEWAGQG